MKANEGKIISILRELAHQYPYELLESQLKDLPRIAFHIALVKQDGNLSGLRVCDIGGGIGLFSVACAALGARTLLIDDFQDPINLKLGNGVLKIHKTYGVEVLARDIVKEDFHDISGEFNAVTSFESMEHWHHSPKTLFHSVYEKLSPGGRFILGVPNCVNLRKRISVPLGRGEWSSMNDWYESQVFRGHVREPNVDDLKYIANDIKLQKVRIYGRNWFGHLSKTFAIRAGTKLADHPLRMFPSLCSDIYLVGEKPLH